MIFRFIFRFILFLALSVSMTLPAFAKDPVILIYGDSLSAAYGIPREQGWVALLQNRISSQNLPHQVVNASISGQTTRGGLSRIDAALKEHKPSILVLELGANDGLRGLPVSEMKNNLERMIQSGLAQKAKVILIGMRIPPNYGSRYTKEFSDVYTNLANQYKLPFVPFMLEGVAGIFDLNIDDGIHPNTKAQPMVLENIWPTLAPILKK